MVGDVWSKLDVDVYFDELSWVEIRKFMNMYERLKPETKILILSTQQKYWNKNLTLTASDSDGSVYESKIQSYKTLLVGKFC